jgi:hypothetical protein
VAWASGIDNWAFGVSAQRFAWPLPLDVDADGARAPLSDGVLVLRFLFGFRGAALTGGAVGAACTRCAPAEIEAHLIGLGLLLDIDGDGVLSALTDGLLVLRFRFGFDGESLTSGATGENCERCDASEITSHFASLDG